MPRFIPTLAIVPIKNKSGTVVDALITAVMAPPAGDPPLNAQTAQRQVAARLVPNPAKKGIELHFPNKPDDAARTELKNAGWRFSPRSLCWYTKDLPVNRKFAEQFIDRQQTVVQREPETTTPTVIEPVPTNIIPPTPLWKQRRLRR